MLQITQAQKNRALTFVMLTQNLGENGNHVVGML